MDDAERPDAAEGEIAASPVVSATSDGEESGGAADSVAVGSPRSSEPAPGGSGAHDDKFSFLKAGELQELKIEDEGAFCALRKAQRRVDTLEEQLVSVRAERDVADINTEQRFQDLEREFWDSRSRYSVLEEECVRLRERCEELSSGKSEIHKEAEALKADLDLRKKEAAVAAEDAQRMAAASEALQIEMKRKEDGYASLKAELEDMRGGFNKLRAEATVHLNKRTEAEIARRTAEHETARLRHESESQKEAIETLSADFKETSDRLREFQVTYSRKSVELQAKVDAAEQSARSSENRREMAVERIDGLERELQTLMVAHKALKDEKAEADEISGQELATQTRLAALYKQSAEAATGKTSELQKTIESLQEALDASRKDKLAISDRLAELHDAGPKRERALEEQLAERNCFVTALEKQLAEARDRLEILEPLKVRMSSAARDASPSASGRDPLEDGGLEAVYDYYVLYMEARNAQRKLQVENAHLRGTVEQIWKELSEKAPQIQNQRAEYERALKSHRQLQTRLQEATVALENSKRDVKELSREKNDLVRDNEDLTTQVRRLLMEGLGGASVPLSGTDSNEKEEEWTFRSVGELQEKNRRLTNMVRELSCERDRLRSFEERESYWKEQMRELKEIREARVRETSMVQSIVRQRDTYRVLLSQYTDLIPQLPAPVEVGAVEQGGEKGAGTAGYSVAFTDLRREFERYKAESDKALVAVRGELRKAEGDVAEGRIQLSKAESEVSLQREKYELLSSSVGTLKSEADELRKRLSESSERFVSLEQVIQETRVEREQLLGETRRTASRIQAAELARSRAEERETGLQNELNRITEEKIRGQRLLDDTQSVVKSLQSTLSDLRKQLGTQLEHVQAELEKSRAELAGERSHAEKSAAAALAERECISSELAVRSKEVGELRVKLESSEIEGSRLRRELELAEGRLRESDDKWQKAMARLDDRGAVLKSENEVQLVRTELAAALEGRKETQEHLARFQHLAAEKDASIASTHEALDALRQEFDKSRSQIESLRAELFRAREGDVDAHASLAKCEKMLENSRKESADLHGQVEQLRKDVQMHALLCQRAQSKYEDEVSRRGDDVKKLKEATAKAENAEQRQRELQGQATTLAETVEQMKKTVEETGRKTADQLAQARSHQESLSRENNLLHEQLKERPVTGGESGQSAAELAGLRELLETQMRQKQIAEAELKRLQVSRAPTAGVMARLAQAQEQKTALSKKLEDALARTKELEAANAEVATLRQNAKSEEQKLRLFTRELLRKHKALEQKMTEMQGAVEKEAVLGAASAPVPKEGAEAVTTEASRGAIARGKARGRAVVARGRAQGGAGRGRGDSVSPVKATTPGRGAGTGRAVPGSPAPGEALPPASPRGRGATTMPLVIFGGKTSGKVAVGKAPQGVAPGGRAAVRSQPHAEQRGGIAGAAHVVAPVLSGPGTQVARGSSGPTSGAQGALAGGRAASRGALQAGVGRAVKQVPGVVQAIRKPMPSRSIQTVARGGISEGSAATPIPVGKGDFSVLPKSPQVAEVAHPDPVVSAESVNEADSVLGKSKIRPDCSEPDQPAKRPRIVREPLVSQKPPAAVSADAAGRGGDQAPAAPLAPGAPGAGRGGAEGSAPPGQ